MRVAVAPAAEYELRRGLFGMLGSKLDLEFEPHMPGNYEGLRGLIALSGAGDAVRGASERGISCYEVNLSQPISLGAQSAITFTSSTAVHGAFRNFAPEAAKNIKGRVLILHGAEDPVAPMEELNAVVSQFRAAKVDFEVNLYSGAAHGFTHPQNPSEVRADEEYKMAMTRFLKGILAH